MGNYSASPAADASSQADANSDGLNVYFDDVSIEFGEIGTLVGPDGRECVSMVFDLSQGGGIAKTATITDVTLTVRPLITQSLSGGDAQHRLALMEPNGQWDRPTSSALHQSNSGIVYGAPSRQATAASFRGRNEAGATIFDTSTAGSGFIFIDTSDAWPSWGCTFKLPANEVLWSLACDMSRRDAGSNKKVKLIIYELEGDGRHFAIKSHLKDTFYVPYNQLVLNIITEQIFTMGPFNPLAASASDRWLGVVVGGEILDDGTIRTTHRLRGMYVGSNDCSIYRDNTEGSMFKLSNVDSNDNSLNDIAYHFSSDIPHIYDGGNTNVLTTPFSRIWTDGNVLSSADATVAWTNGVDYKYGSLAGSNIFSGIVAELQAWLDSDNYDPDNGRHHIGIMLEPCDPDEETWPIASANITLTIGFTNRTLIHAGGGNRTRVEATFGVVVDRVRADMDERTRIFVADEARDRVRPIKEKTGGRVRAPESYVRSQT